MYEKAAGEAEATVPGRTEGRVADPDFNVAENAGGGFITSMLAFFFFFLNGWRARTLGYLAELSKVT